MYRAIAILNIPIEWAESQHLNFILKLLQEISRDEKETKGKQISNSVIYQNMTDK